AIPRQHQGAVGAAHRPSPRCDRREARPARGKDPGSLRDHEGRDREADRRLAEPPEVTPRRGLVRLRTDSPGKRTMTFPERKGPRVSNPKQNLLLAALSPAELKRLRRNLEPVEMPLGDVVYESGRHQDHVYFPTTCIVSLLYVLENGASA